MPKNMSGEIAVVTGGAVQWRFFPHAHDTDAHTIVTPRVLSYPPVPIGATLLLGAEPLGEVTNVTPAKMRRWQVTYQPATIVADELSLLGIDEATVAHLRQAGLRVQDLYGLHEEDLQDIEGVGPRRARDIRSAIDRHSVSVTGGDELS